MAKPTDTETETHHNQPLTDGAAKRMEGSPSPVAKDGASEAKGKAKRKVVVLQLNEKERAALAHLGGVDGLKQLLCPPGVCIACRKNPADDDSRWQAYCGDCRPG